MSLWDILQIYLLVATAVAGTSYITIYRPAIYLLEEILEVKTEYSSIITSAIWFLFAIIFAPAIIVVLLTNNNNKFIVELVNVLLNNFAGDDGDL